MRKKLPRENPEIEVQDRTLDKLYETTAVAFFRHHGAEAAKKKSKKKLVIRGEDKKNLLCDFLETLLEMHGGGFAFAGSEVTIHRTMGYLLEATVYGEEKKTQKIPFKGFLREKTKVGRKKHLFFSRLILAK